MGWQNSDKSEVVKEVVGLLSGISLIKKIILFGSFARGNHQLLSDVDLLVIGDFGGKILERRLELYKSLRAIHKRIDIDLFPLREDEIEELLKKDSPFIKEIYRKGEVIYERGV